MTTQIQQQFELSEYTAIAGANPNALAATNRLSLEYVQATIPSDTRVDQSYCMIGGDAPKEKEKPAAQGPIEKLCQTIKPEKDLALDKRITAVDDAWNAAFISGKKEDKQALAEALLKNFGNIKIEKDSKEEKLLQFAATGSAGDLAALMACRILYANGQHWRHQVGACSMIARIATKADDADVQKEASAVLAKLRTRFRKEALNGLDPDEEGLPEDVKKAIKAMDEKQVEQFKEYRKTLLKIMDDSVARAKKEK